MRKRLANEPTIKLVGPSDEGSNSDLYEAWEIARGFALRWEVSDDDAKEIASAVTNTISDARRTKPGFLAGERERKRYLYGGVQKAVISLWRRQQRFVRIESVADQLPAPEPSARSSEQSERLAFVYAQVEKLPARCREAWRLRYMEERMPREIARSLKRSVKTIDAHIRHGTKTIQAAWDEHRRRTNGEQP